MENRGEDKHGGDSQIQCSTCDPGDPFAFGGVEEDCGLAEHCEGKEVKEMSFGKHDHKQARDHGDPGG